MNRQSGQGRLGFVITLAIFVVGIFLAVKIVPVRVSGLQFREALREEARNAAVHNRDKEVRQRILDTAKEMQIPLDPKKLTISRTTKEIAISATYEKPVDLTVTTYTYKFSTRETAPVF